MRILIFEDDSNVLSLVKGLLAGWGHHAVEGRLDQSAEKQLESEAYDVVLTDIQMPRLSGGQILRWTRRHRPGVPVIGMSGSGVAELARHGLSTADFASFLFKPFRGPQVLKALELALRVPRNMSSEGNSMREGTADLK